MSANLSELNDKAKQSNIKLSVVTLSFHRPESLLKKLEALERCDLDKHLFEIVIGFNDRDAKLVEKIKGLNLSYQSQLLLFSENIGISKGRNQCIDAAQGNIIYFSDDDCIPESNTLTRHLKAQEKQAAVYIGAILFKDGDSEHTWIPKQVNYGNTNGANTSIPKHPVEAVNGFDESLQGYGGEDILLGYRLKELGLKFYALSDACTTHEGPDPALSKNTKKAFSAGHNAVKIAQHLPPNIKFRLGVHPLLLALKRVVLNPITMSLFPKSATLLYEKAYLDGALSAKQKKHNN